MTVMIATLICPASDNMFCILRHKLTASFDLVNTAA